MLWGVNVRSLAAKVVNIVLTILPEWYCRFNKIINRHLPRLPILQTDPQSGRPPENHYHEEALI
jgi:hypothetical protein